MGNIGDVGDLFVNIGGNTQPLKNAVKETNSILQNLSDTMKTSFGSVAIGIGEFAAVKYAFNQVVGVFEEGLKMMEAAVQRSQDVITLGIMAKSLNMNADSIVEGMNRASAGMVDNTKMIMDAKRALALGLKENEMVAFMDAARLSARIMGTDVSQAFNNISYLYNLSAYSMTRAARMFTRETGIMLDVREKLTAYAKEYGIAETQILSFQKQQMFLNSVLEATQKGFDETGGKIANFGEELKAREVHIKDLMQKIKDDLMFAAAKGFFSNFLEELDFALDGMKKAEPKIISFFSKWWGRPIDVAENWMSSWVVGNTTLPTPIPKAEKESYFPNRMPTSTSGLEFAGGEKIHTLTEEQIKALQEDKIKNLKKMYSEMKAYTEDWYNFEVAEANKELEANTYLLNNRELALTFYNAKIRKLNEEYRKYNYTEVQNFEREVTLLTATEWEKREIEIKQKTVKLNELNFKFLMDGRVTREEFKNEFIAIEKAESDKILENKQKHYSALKEMEIAHRKTLLDIAEIEHTMGVADIIKERLNLEKQELIILQQTLKTLQETGQENTDAWIHTKEAIDKTSKAVAELTLKLKEQEGSFEEGFRYGFDEYVRTADRAFKSGAAFAKQAADITSSHLASVFEDLRKGTMNWSTAIQGFANDILKALEQIIAKLIVVKMMESAIGGGGGSGILSGILGMFGSSASQSMGPQGAEGILGHDGGYVTRQGIIPEFHTGGLAADEMFAKLQVGERVLTEAQNARYENMMRGNMNNISVPVNVEGNKIMASELHDKIESLVVDIIRRHS